MKMDIEIFLTYLREVKKTSENTTLSYERDLRKLNTYLEGLQITKLNDITTEVLQQYIHDLKDNGKKPSTISRRIASMKAFFGYAKQQGYLETDIAASLKAPRIERGLPGILTTEETFCLLQQPAGDKPKELRDKAMLELLYATGIRVSELISLKLPDVNLSMDYIICHDRKKDRVIPITDEAKKALCAYLENGRNKLIQDEELNLLFTNCSGQAMSRQGFWKLLKTYGQKAGISCDLTPYTLRHSFAAHMVSNGADLRSVQELMGHADIATTQKYSQMNAQRIREIYQKTHPRQIKK